VCFIAYTSWLPTSLQRRASGTESDQTMPVTPKTEIRHSETVTTSRSGEEHLRLKIMANSGEKKSHPRPRLPLGQGAKPKGLQTFDASKTRLRHGHTSGKLLLGFWLCSSRATSFAHSAATVGEHLALPSTVVERQYSPLQLLSQKRSSLLCRVSDASRV